MPSGGEEQRPAHTGQGVRDRCRTSPGLMSLTRTVPASVPSDFHSSRPWVPSSAVKNNVPPTPVRDVGVRSSSVAGVDVLDQDRARLGAVRLPQLLAVGAVVGSEEQRPAHTVRDGRAVVP